MIWSLPTPPQAHELTILISIEAEIHVRPLRIALLYNLKKHVALRFAAQPSAGAPADALAEYDSEETVEGLRAALGAQGHEVIPLEGDETLLDAIRQVQPDICFNICEGLRGDSRESHVPAILEMLGIPYTASKVLTHAISLDKVTTKRLWRDQGLPTAPFQVFLRGDEPLGGAARDCAARDCAGVPSGLAFPLFVKPSREGTGMGINGDSVVYDSAALRRQVAWVLDTYHQPALVEQYLPGREFTVGIVGNRLCADEPPRSGAPEGFYDSEGYHVFPALEIDVGNLGGAGRLYTGHIKSVNPLGPRYLCPAPISDELAAELRALTIRAFEAIGSLDVARVDFRLGPSTACRGCGSRAPEGQPFLLEVNTLPGLNPTLSDMVMAAEADGVPYATMINQILALALRRYGLDADVLHPSAPQDVAAPRELAYTTGS